MVSSIAYDCSIPDIGCVIRMVQDACTTEPQHVGIQYAVYRIPDQHAIWHTISASRGWIRPDTDWVIDAITSGSDPDDIITSIIIDDYGMHIAGIGGDGRIMHCIYPAREMGIRPIRSHRATYQIAADYLRNHCIAEILLSNLGVGESYDCNYDIQYVCIGSDILCTLSPADVAVYILSNDIGVSATACLLRVCTNTAPGIISTTWIDPDGKRLIVMIDQIDSDGGNINVSD